MDKALYHSPKKQQDELLTFFGDPEVDEPGMFEIGMYLSIYYFLCCEMDLSTDISEGQVSEYRDPDLNEEDDIRMDKMN